MEDFAPAVGSSTAILPLLNGMRHLDALEARFGAEHVLGGTTYLVADLDADGGVHSMTPLHDLSFGERDKVATERIKAIEDDADGRRVRCAAAAGYSRDDVAEVDDAGVGRRDYLPDAGSRLER